MLRKKIWIGICVLLFLAIAILFLYRTAITGPEFYRDSLSLENESASALGEELENSFLENHNNIIRADQWSLRISDDQLNGWFRAALSNKYPRFRPEKIDNLTFDFQDGKIQVAFRAKQSVIPIVIQVGITPFITENELHIAVRLDDIRTGWIPLPKKQAVDQINNTLSRAEIPVAWTSENSRPVGLLPIHFSLPEEFQRRIEVKEITVKEGELILAGTAADSK